MINPQNEPTVHYLRHRQRCDVVVKKVKQLAAKKNNIFTVFSVTIFPKCTKVPKVGRNIRVPVLLSN